MELEVRLRRRAASGEDVREINSLLVGCLSKISNFWAEGRLPEDVYFNAGTGESAAADLSPCLCSGIRGAVSYASRVPAAVVDKAHSDDVLTLHVDIDRVDFLWLSRSVFPELVNCFGSYRGGIVTDIDLDLDDFEEACEVAQATGRDIDGRDTVFRIYPVNFFDNEMCRRAFGISAADVASRLRGSLEKVEERNGGVFIYTGAEPPGRDDIITLDNWVKQRLAT